MSQTTGQRKHFGQFTPIIIKLETRILIARRDTPILPYSLSGL